jgi:hypothetical protein
MDDPPESPSALDERILRMKLMDVEIQQRLHEIDQANKQDTLETRRFVVQAVLAAAAPIGAGVAVGRFVPSHQ